MYSHSSNDLDSGIDGKHYPKIHVMRGGLILDDIWKLHSPVPVIQARN
jgi:hypothetical protein